MQRTRAISNEGRQSRQSFGLSERHTLHAGESFLFLQVPNDPDRKTFNLECIVLGYDDCLMLRGQMISRFPPFADFGTLSVDAGFSVLSQAFRSL
ncbi:MAG: hypothetical protein K2Q17_07380 [Nitrospiraceae bacterium]|nr:hypothetical protein [Nitrospiraceae bacterium]